VLLWGTMNILSFQKTIFGLMFRLLVSTSAMESSLSANPTIGVRFAHQVRLKTLKAARSPSNIPGNDTTLSQASPAGESILSHERRYYYAILT
jgi:hypothetical protein